VIKAIIFDCFGVLATDGWKQLRQEFFSDDEERMRKALDLDKAVNGGMMDYATFIHEVAHLAQLSKAEVHRRMNGNVPDRLLFEFIRSDLKSRYKLAVLSNAANDWLNDLFEPWQVQLFDEIVLSYQVGLVKPETEIYQLTANRLGVLPEECIFIDDIERYCMAAAELGMKTIVHSNPRDTIAQVKEIIHNQSN